MKPEVMQAAMSLFHSIVSTLQASKRLMKHSSVKDLDSEISSLGQSEMVGKSHFSYPVNVAELKDWMKFTNTKQIRVFRCSGVEL